MSDSKTNVAGLIISTGGEYADDLAFILRHPASNATLSEHTSNAAAHAAASKFAEYADWSGARCMPHGATSRECRVNARAINRLTDAYARDKRDGRA